MGETYDEKWQPVINAMHAKSRILEAILNKAPEIVEFRKKYLRGKLLSEKEVSSWIEGKKKKETFKKPIERNELEYYTPESEGIYRIERIFFRQNDVFWELKRLARKLSPYWREGAAVLFILTGKGAPIKYASYSLTDLTYGAKYILSTFSRPMITLTVSPALPGDCVKSLYYEAKEEFKKDFPYRFIWEEEKLVKEERLLWLAVFVSKELAKRGRETKGINWQGLLEKWNSEYLEELKKRFPGREQELEGWKYNNTTSIKIKAGYAIKSLTGFEWKRFLEFVKR